MESVNVWMWNIANESFVTYCRLSLMVVVVEVEVSTQNDRNTMISGDWCFIDNDCIICLQWI